MTLLESSPVFLSITFSSLITALLIVFSSVVYYFTNWYHAKLKLTDLKEAAGLVQEDEDVEPLGGEAGTGGGEFQHEVRDEISAVESSWLTSAGQ